MYYFTTLFDSNYLAKGLALYRSLERVCEDFHLYIFAFDDKAFSILKALGLKNASVMSLAELESFCPSLLTVKSERNVAEYCWTCKGPTIQYCIRKNNLNHCTYLDSDIYFFSSPNLLFESQVNADVLLTEHHYTKSYDLSETNGKYCAQFMSFRSNENGLKVLDWWTDLCIDWCFAKHEPGKFGDQKYLEYFESKYSNIGSVDLHCYAGPWAIQQYRVQVESGILKIIRKKPHYQSDLVFFHFHFLTNQHFGVFNEFLLGPYKLNHTVKAYIYTPYILELKKIYLEIKIIDASFDSLGSRKYVPFSVSRIILHYIKNFWKPNRVLWKRN